MRVDPSFAPIKSRPETVDRDYVGTQSLISDISEDGFDLALVTPTRFGGILRGAREEHRIPITEMAQLSEGQFSVEELEIAEGGWRVYETSTIRDLLALYCVDARPMSDPSLLRVRHGVMSVGSKKKRYLPFANKQRLLVNYLAFMHGLRGTQPGSYAVLRASDLHELARVLGTNWLSVKRELEHLMVEGHRRVERATRPTWRRFAIPLAVVVIGASAAVYHTHYRTISDSIGSGAQAAVDSSPR